METICEKLNSLPSPTDDINCSWINWKSQFLKILSLHIPTRHCRVRKSLPWISPHLLKLIRKRNSAFFRYKSTKSQVHLCKYRLLRNKTVTAIRKAKCKLFNDLSSAVRVPKHFWSLYHSLFPSRQRIPPMLHDGSTTVESATNKANLLVSHFSSCFSLPSHGSACICNPITQDLSPSKHLGSCLSTISCSPEDVYKLLIQVKVRTAPGPDGISSHMLRHTAHVITPTLMKLFNSSLSLGVVPTDWKISNVTPVFKSKGDPQCVLNYRPISLLSLLSKILE